MDERAEAGIETLRSIVQSPSPSLREGRADDPSTAVGKIYAAARKHGTAVDVQNVAPQSDNVIEVAGRRGKHSFVIEAHTDAVPEGDRSRWRNGDPYSGEEGWVTYVGHDEVEVQVGGDRYRARIRPRMSKIWERFRRERKRRILYGRGSFDNKGCVASALLAMEAISAASAATGIELGGSVVAAYTADEEDGVAGVTRFACAGDSWLAGHGYLDGPRDSNDFLTDISGVALDGSYGWVPVIGHRGAVQLAITTHGRAAHAATPELGANAVDGMARLLVALTDGVDEIRAAVADVLETSLLGPLTMAVGSTIAGGGVRSVRNEGERVVERSGINAIPDWCEATVDIRFPQGHRYPLDSEQVKDRIVEAVRRHLERHVNIPDVRHEVRELGVWGQPVAMAQNFESAARLPLIGEERRCVKQVLGFEPELETAPGGTDATFMIHDAKIPTIVELGPAGGLSHDVHEFVETDSVVEGAKILALLAIARVGVSG